MSFHIDLNTCYHGAQLDPHVTAKNFCDLYYGTIMTKGFCRVSYLFDASAHCNYNGAEYIGLHNVLIAMANEGIMKLMHDRLTYSTSVIDNNTLIVQVTGLCQGITFWNLTTSVYQFAETFALKYVNGSIFVSNYLFKLV